MVLTTEQINIVFDRIIKEAVPFELQDQVSDELDLLTVGIDSFKLIKLIMQLEDELGIFWPVEQLAEHDKYTVVGRLREACHRYASSMFTFKGDLTNEA